MTEDIHALGAEGEATFTEMPREPFACPECGQMLAPECRVCVACRKPIDLARVSYAPTAPPPQPTQPKQAPAAKGKTQFSWPMFLAFVGGWIVLANVVAYFFHGVPTDLAAAAFALQLVCAAWVFYDARHITLPHPWRWGLLTLFLWLIFFPWYLNRRRTPESPCPVIEAQTSVLFRALVWFVLLMLAFTVVAMIFKSPPR